jgi:hypothetical protein
MTSRTTKVASVNPHCPQCEAVADYAGACSGTLSALIDHARRRTFPDAITLAVAVRHLAGLRRAAGSTARGDGDERSRTYCG